MESSELEATVTNYQALSVNSMPDNNDFTKVGRDWKAKLTTIRTNAEELDTACRMRKKVI